jgi:hypothetical protein
LKSEIVHSFLNEVKFKWGAIYIWEGNELEVRQTYKAFGLLNHWKKSSNIQSQRYQAGLLEFHGSLSKS